MKRLFITLTLISMVSMVSTSALATGMVISYYVNGVTYTNADHKSFIDNVASHHQGQEKPCLDCHAKNGAVTVIHSKCTDCHRTEPTSCKACHEKQSIQATW